MDTFAIPDHPSHSKNIEKLRGDVSPCIVCGKPAPNPRYMARISDGGVSFATDEYADRPENIAGDLGCYPVGPECYRKLPPEAKALIIDCRKLPVGDCRRTS